jgi:hypothetical protein
MGQQHHTESRTFALTENWLRKHFELDDNWHLTFSKLGLLSWDEYRQQMNTVDIRFEKNRW